jgi:hypothetical protein
VTPKTKVRNLRIPPVAGRFSEGPLTEPTADAQGLVTGTGLYAPYLPLAILVRIGSVGRKPDLGFVALASGWGGAEEQRSGVPESVKDRSGRRSCCSPFLITLIVLDQCLLFRPAICNRDGI